MERRKLNRLRLGEHSFALIVNGVRTLGEILDISKGGMAFKYIVEESGFRPISGTVMLQIFDREKNIRLNDLSFKVTSDTLIEKPRFLSGVLIRRLGGNYKAPTPDQREQIEKFISTVGREGKQAI